MQYIKYMCMFGMAVSLLMGGCAPGLQKKELDWLPQEVPPEISNEVEKSEEVQEEPEETYEVAQKVLVVGNSITLGFGTHGMASSAVDTDYYYLLNQYLLEKNPEVQMKRIPGYAWESGTSTEARNKFLEETLKPELRAGYDTLIIQLGDNVNMPEKLTTFANDADEMLRVIRETTPEIRILWVFGRYNLSNAVAIQQACKKHDAEYVDISVVSTGKKYQAEMNSEYEKEDGTIGIIQDHGVASHPNDVAMKVISELIIEQLDYDEKGQ